MEQNVALIEKYKARLDPKNDLKKLCRALQKLNEIDVTKEMMEVTGIAITVNRLRKTKGLEDLAKKIIKKWKKVADNSDNNAKMQSKPKKRAIKLEAELAEYDPAKNWELRKTSYDVRDGPALYSPAKILVKTEGKKQLTERPRKRKRDMKEAAEKVVKKAPRLDREAELRATLLRTQRELEKMEQHRKRSEARVKQEPVDSATEEFLSPPEPEDFEEYDPGPVEGGMSYQPSKVCDTKSSWDSEHDKDSEGSFADDEPGAYLLQRRRTGSDHDLSDEESEGSQGRFVQSTTLYSRHKSVDSEDGMWGSKVNGIKVEQEDDSLSFGASSQSIKLNKQFPESFSKNLDEFSNSDNPERVVTSSNTSSRKSSNRSDMNVKIEKTGKKSKSYNNYEKLKTGNKSTKKVEVKLEKAEAPKTKTKKAKHSKVLEKQKLNNGLWDDPAHAKMKSQEAKNHKIKEAGFLFEDIPNVSSVNTKVKRSKKVKKAVEITPIPKPKLNLHLPEAQAVYRPLPHSNSGILPDKPKSNEPLTDNQAAELHSKRQTKKMLVYSGRGGGVLPKMMSLYDQCMGVLMNNIDAIESFGGIPYDIVKPILKKCTPEQLYRLEDASPYLLDDTALLWQHHGMQEFRGKKPGEMESWREMYLRLSDEREAKLRCLTRKIQAKEAKKKPLEKKVMLAYVGASAKPPRSVRRAQERHGTGVDPRHSFSDPSTSRSGASSVRREIVDSRRVIPVGSITAANVDREDRMRQIREAKKPRVAPMMAKTLQTIGKLRFKR